MKEYDVDIEVTTFYRVRIPAETRQESGSKAWKLDINEVEAQGSANETKITYVDTENIEEIQRESENEEDNTNYRIATEGQREFGGSAG